MEALKNLAYLVGRLIVRSARISLGACIGFIGYLIGDAGLDKLGVPFAQNSLLGLIYGLFLCWLAAMVLWGAFATAFGAAPEREPAGTV